MYIETEPKYKGIAGWLILPLLGLIISPLRVSWSLYQDFLPIFTEGYWDVLTTPGTEAYHPLWTPVLIFEFSSNVMFIILPFVTLWFFCKESRLAPKLVIAWLALTPLVLGLDLYLTGLIPAVADQSDPETDKEFVRGVIGAAIWIPYFLVSKRVKATFVN